MNVRGPFVALGVIVLVLSPILYLILKPAKKAVAPVAPVERPQEHGKPSPGSSALDKIRAIAAESKKTHTYTASGGYVCRHMALDVWNKLMTAGIHAKLVCGRSDAPPMRFENTDPAVFGAKMKYILSLNHAWVLAEYEPLKWAYVETTAGLVFRQNEQPSGFRGLIFDNGDQYEKHIVERDDWLKTCFDFKDKLDRLSAYQSQKGAVSAEIKGRFQQKFDDCGRASLTMVKHVDTYYQDLAANP